MPEPTSAAASLTTLVASTVVVAPVLSVFGVPLGLQADVLLAGFLGAVAAIALLDIVPSSGDTTRELLRTSLRRIGAAVGSAVTAGYLTPLVSLFASVPGSATLAVAFVTGAGAQRLLKTLLNRLAQNVSNGGGAK